MTLITVFVSHWDGEMSVSPLPEDEPLFRSLGRMGLLIEDRTMIMAPEPDRGILLKDLDRRRNAGLGIVLRWGRSTLPLANWMRHSVEMEIDDEDMLIWEVPPDHELPWPQLARCKEHKRQRLAERELILRARSAANAGCFKRILGAVPRAYRDILPAETWRYIVDQIIKENLDARDARPRDVRHAA